jgi:hypothetical protein
MTETQRIDRLENRVTKIEDDVWAKLDAIERKITDLAVAVASMPHCPAPGKCNELESRLGRIESTYDNLAKTVAELIRWRAWLTGINLVISTISLAALAALGSYVVKNL